MSKHKHKNKWFIKVRGSYLPDSWQGWLLYIPYTAYVLGVVVYAWYNFSSFWTGVFVVVPNWVVALAVMTWIAQRTS